MQWEKDTKDCAGHRSRTLQKTQRPRVVGTVQEKAAKGRQANRHIQLCGFIQERQYYVESENLVMAIGGRQMKVRFQMREGKVTRARTGKGLFVQRLYKEFDKRGVKWTEDRHEPVDIDVCISKPLYVPDNAKKRILRLGPVEYDTMRKDLQEQWKVAKKYRKRCHGIIYQSRFAKDMNYAFLGRPKRGQEEAIIFNGADPEEYALSHPVKKEFATNFVLSTREYVWEKRLRDVIEGYLYNPPKKSCLWIAGQVWDTPKRFPPAQRKFEKKYARHNVRFLGQLPRDEVVKLLRLCDVFLHCVYVDACPNALCEAMCAGCKVIATPCGGQYEMLLNYLSIIVDGDPRMPPEKPYNRRKPPHINRKALNDAMQLAASGVVSKEYQARVAEHVHISTIADKYLKFFEKVLAS